MFFIQKVLSNKVQISSTDYPEIVYDVSKSDAITLFECFNLFIYGINKSDNSLGYEFSKLNFPQMIEIHSYMSLLTRMGRKSTFFGKSFTSAEVESFCREIREQNNATLVGDYYNMFPLEYSCFDTIPVEIFINEHTKSIKLFIYRFDEELDKVDLYSNIEMYYKKLSSLKLKYDDGYLQITTDNGSIFIARCSNDNIFRMDTFSSYSTMRIMKRSGIKDKSAERYSLYFDYKYFQNLDNGNLKLGKDVYFLADKEIVCKEEDFNNYLNSGFNNYIKESIDGLDYIYFAGVNIFKIGDRELISNFVLNDAEYSPWGLRHRDKIEKLYKYDSEDDKLYCSTNMNYNNEYTLIDLSVMPYSYKEDSMQRYIFDKASFSMLDVLSNSRENLTVEWLNNFLGTKYDTTGNIVIAKSDKENFVRLYDFTEYCFFEQSVTSFSDRTDKTCIYYTDYIESEGRYVFVSYYDGSIIDLDYDLLKKFVNERLKVDYAFGYVVIGKSKMEKIIAELHDKYFTDFIMYSMFNDIYLDELCVRLPDDIKKFILDPKFNLKIDRTKNDYGRYTLIVKLEYDEHIMFVGKFDDKNMNKTKISYYLYGDKICIGFKQMQCNNIILYPLNTMRYSSDRIYQPITISMDIIKDFDKLYQNDEIA